MNGTKQQGKPGKHVGWDTKEEVHQPEDKGQDGEHQDEANEEEDEGEALLKLVQEKQQKSIPPEQAEELFDKLAKEFVKSKEAKLSRCARCYLCLQRSYVT